MLLRSGTIEVVPRSVCRDGKLQPISRPHALPRSVWRVRWAQGGVCPAVSARYNGGGAAERLQGWQAAAYIKTTCAAAERLEGSVGPGPGCVWQFRSGTLEVVPRSGRTGRCNRGGAAECLQGWEMQPISRPDALPQSIWRARCAQGGVCPTVSERYDGGGAAERLQGWQAAAYIKARCAAAERLEGPWAPGEVFPAVSERYNRGGAAVRLQGWQAECCGNGSNRGIDREKLRSTPRWSQAPPRPWLGPGSADYPCDCMCHCHPCFLFESAPARHVGWKLLGVA